MRLVIQRVLESSVKVDGNVVGAIGAGFMVLCGVQEGDTLEDVKYCVEKTAGLRIFEDADDKMNLSVQDVGGSILAVSQFTLLGDARKGKRPSFIAAARPEAADALYEKVVTRVRELGVHCETGVFQTHMEVELVNDGPVTILYDTGRLF